MTTIRDIITLAYGDLGIAGLSPEEEATGRTMLAVPAAAALVGRGLPVGPAGAPQLGLESGDGVGEHRWVAAALNREADRPVVPADDMRASAGATFRAECDTEER